ncbi:hypothetical protein DPMN_134777 [Dreissena polymorpha]|uniref:Mitochondria-eating protein C-terminal domain-containing protein n=2 Tax=Dreissena polymorpha TaxID=45954 RepID=A0A9D4G0B9_DREPO|nr:hypothetical protein DPMN_134777 [Dreissena polymorpha]
MIIRPFGTRLKAMALIAPFVLGYGIQTAIRYFRPSRPADDKESENCSDNHISDTKRQIDGLNRDILEKDAQIAGLRRDLENERQTSTHNARRYEQQVFKLQEDFSRVEAEKQDALTRLSALMSVKLRDNNPNIADLSDQFRPTKLAEMFSELYDNEWTDAFTAVSKDLSERQTITFLLDIIMGAYAYCTKEMDMSWRVVSEWYLDPSLPNEQQMRKLLKDARKVAVVKMTDQISKKYQTRIQSICSVPTLLEMLSTKAVGSYVMQSLRLCLLMCANDPPVVIKCQDVIEEACGDLKQSNGANKPGKAVSNEKLINAEIEEKEKKTHTEGQDVVDTGLTGSEFQNNLDEQATEEESKNEEQARGALNIHTANEQPLCGETNTEGSQTSGAMREIENESGTKNIPKRQPFDREKFKEYTSRGPYLEYVVWPVMYLHQGGPMLGKGVAQGTSEAVCRWEEEQWSWKVAE